jgi:lipid-binding SYLF domain-containing protein
MKLLICVVLALGPAIAFAAKDQSDTVKRVATAAVVFDEIMAAPDRGVPHELLEQAQCIGIVPGLKRAGFIVGAKYGKGVLVCRTANRAWSAPSTIRIEGGSVGLQIGAGETDLLFIVKNRRGEEKLLQDKFTFGGDASAMAGPVGRTAQAQTDAQMHAEILSYSRARGVFAGISLEGSTLRPDNEDNRELYGRELTQKEILTGPVHRPAQTAELYSKLDRYTVGPKHSAAR